MKDCGSEDGYYVHSYPSKGCVSVARPLGLAGRRPNPSVEAGDSREQVEAAEQKYSESTGRWLRSLSQAETCGDLLAKRADA